MFEPFDISVLGAGKHVWVSAQSRQGSVFGVARRPPEWGLGEATPAEWLTTNVRQAHQVGDRALEVGQVLHDLVFGEPSIANLLAQTRGVAAADGAQLLVRVLAAPQEVSSWPWELMPDPQQPSRFLTMARDVHLVRAGRSRTYPVRETTVDPPLNVLLVMSSPLIADPNETETPFDLWAEKRSLLSTLQPLVDRGVLNVVVEDRPTIERLRERMCAERRGFHVVHYLGHANPYGLRLQQRGGRGLLVRSQDFAMLLQQMPDLRLVVFAGCETARAPAGAQDAPDRYSTADVCVRDACPMVVGMQAVLPFGTERIFTKFFYEALTGGQTVAQSLRLARHAIADDGSRLLNWAVPSLFVGGSEPGQVMNPAARATPPPPRRHLALKLGIRQRELRFIARLNQIREAVDMLSGHTSSRLLVVIGPPETGKTSLLDRAIEELDEGIASLFISAKRLLSFEDPVLELAKVVAERIDASGYVTPSRQGKLDSDAWWERLLEDLARVPFALVIDDGDLLRSPTRASERLAHALGLITMRRGSARLAVIATDELSVLTAPLGPGEARTIRLQALSWDEVWQWIRRNLPVLTRIKKAELCGYYAKLPHLEQWERLAEEIMDRGITDEVPDLVRQIAGSLNAGGPEAAPPLFDSPVNPHVVRVAVAGPHSVRKGEQFVERMTRVAAENHVAGRMAGVSSSDRSLSLAELLVIRTPFYDTPTPLASDVLAWVIQVLDAGANVIQVDYDFGPLPAEILDRAAAENRLIIQVRGDVIMVGDARFAEDQSALLEAAILVWATDRNLKAQDVRQVLVSTASSDGRLDLDAALFQVRSQQLLDALEWGPLELDALLAETGMKPELVVPLLERLRTARKIKKVGVERYENPESLHSAYKRLCLQQLGRVDETEFRKLDSRVGALARRRRFTSDEPRALWNTGDDGRRLIALVITKARPDLGTPDIVIDGITEPRSPMEQLLALEAADEMLEQLSTHDRARLRVALRAAQSHGRSVELSDTRSELATRLADRLPEVA
ncbi:CHAT domain-containing protein [Kibdelosporangium philippinense]|uniref:CHAT domain-containing protein n=1 Tax=Kibdelosporangium philippinense TaxID=211113 RepID=A0ABS8ZRZ4_9PSEU|nr:CHAT domain-containing protein [Kibdelosporangium philippinense]MCE7010372.1 CHAT domain-containing protein [Kibdelosporangium philippinense]